MAFRFQGRFSPYGGPQRGGRQAFGNGKNRRREVILQGNQQTRSVINTDVSFKAELMDEVPASPSFSDEASAVVKGLHESQRVHVIKGFLTHCLLLNGPEQKLRLEEYLAGLLYLRDGVYCPGHIGEEPNERIYFVRVAEYSKSKLLSTYGMSPTNENLAGLGSLFTDACASIQNRAAGKTYQRQFTNNNGHTVRVEVGVNAVKSKLLSYLSGVGLNHEEKNTLAMISRQAALQRYNERTGGQMVGGGKSTHDAGSSDRTSNICNLASVVPIHQSLDGLFAIANDGNISSEQKIGKMNSILNTAVQIATTPLKKDAVRAIRSFINKGELYNPDCRSMISTLQEMDKRQPCNPGLAMAPAWRISHYYGCGATLRENQEMFVETHMKLCVNAAWYAGFGCSQSHEQIAAMDFSLMTQLNASLGMSKWSANSLSFLFKKAGVLVPYLPARETGPKTDKIIWTMTGGVAPEIHYFPQGRGNAVSIAKEVVLRYDHGVVGGYTGSVLQNPTIDRFEAFELTQEVWTKIMDEMSAIISSHQKNGITNFLPGFKKLQGEGEESRTVFSPDKAYAPGTLVRVDTGHWTSVEDFNNSTADYRAAVKAEIEKHVVAVKNAFRDTPDTSNLIHGVRVFSPLGTEPSTIIKERTSVALARKMKISYQSLMRMPQVLDLMEREPERFESVISGRGGFASFLEAGEQEGDSYPEFWNAIKP